MKFQRSSEHSLIEKHVLSYIMERDIIDTKVYHIEKLLINNELNLNSLKIKNEDNIKIYEQNYFILEYTYKPKKSSQDTVLYLELKWPKEMYSIVGTIRFELQEVTKRKEIVFIPIESGFANYPQLMLVEMKRDGSEYQHLLNDFQSSNQFFIKEHLMKQTKFQFN